MLFDVLSGYAGRGIQAEGDGPANTAVLLMQANPMPLERKKSVQLYTTSQFVAARKRASAARTVREVAEFVLIPEIPVAYLKAEGHAEARASASVARNAKWRRASFRRDIGRERKCRVGRCRRGTSRHGLGRRRLRSGRCPSPNRRRSRSQRGPH